MHQRLAPTLVILVFSFSVAIAVAQKPELSVQTGHAAHIVSLAFSTDGKILASGSVDQTIKLWDPATGHQLRALKGQWSVNSLAFSPDDKVLASASADNTIKLLDVATGRERQTLRGHTLYVSAVAFSPDGRMLASGSADGKAKLWDLATGRELRTLLLNMDPNNSMGIRVLFSRDGKTLVSSGEVVKLWDVRSGTLLRTINAVDVNPDPDAPLSVPDVPIAISFDGNVLATGGKSVKLWDVATGKALRTLPGEAHSIVFSPDGQTLAGCYLTEIKLWNIMSGKEVQTWKGPRTGVEVVAFHPDGTILASGNEDNTVRFWDPMKGQELRVFKGYTDSVVPVVLSADGKVLANGVIGSIARNDTIRIWDPTTGQLVRSLLGQEGATFSIGLSNDGRRLVASGGGSSDVGLWNVSQPEEVKRFQASHGSRLGNPQVTLSGNGRLLAAGSQEGTIVVWDVDTGRELFTAKGPRKGIRAIGFSPNGDVVATGGENIIQLWSATSGQQLATLRGHSRDVVALAFSPDGKKLVSGSQDYQMFLWDVASGEFEEEFVGHSAWVNAVAFSRDGQKLASGSEDGLVRIWDVATHRPLHTLMGHVDRVNSVTFTADSRMLISGSHDTSMKLWDVAAGKELASLFALGQQDWLVITPDGLFDGSPASWNQILWRFSASLFDVAPVELFFNEYYYPGLLADLYGGKRPVAPQNISQKDRRQPTLKLTVDEEQVAAAQTRSRNVTAKIEIGAAPAGAQDVRLFRNGALVKLWRGDVLKGQSRTTLEAEIAIVAGPNRLTAYAFNRDNVKSADATLTITGADTLKRAGTLYILAIAVNKYANPQFDLRYAVADATDFAAELKSQEAKLKNYERTEIIPLHDAQATKANILRAFTDLVTRVKPEDAVVVYYAGHGTAQQNQFYLIPHDLGYRGERGRIDAAGLEAILARSISDRELERAFEGVDAGQFLLVIDACNSGQALEAEEKRRGPMNSRGLAQLAYEKGMYVLTAAQSYQAAMEAAKLGHGYLTYALVEEGLKTSAADIQPKDGQILLKEWLDYATQRVPQMQEEKMKEVKGRQLEQIVAFVPGEEKTDPAKRNLQRPRVFYRRELGAEPFVVARSETGPPK